MEQIDWTSAEGSTHWDPRYRNYLRQFVGFSLVWNNVDGWAKHHGQYEDDLNTMTRLIHREPWTGEGLPPVGTECLLSDDSVAGVLVKILAHHGCYALFCREGEYFGRAAKNFRKIKTVGEIVAEERQKFIDECGDFSSVTTRWTDVFGMMYDAGYRKTTTAAQ